MSEAGRFLRQLLLPEIGEAGQARIGRASARVAGPAASLAHEVARRYALAAGFGAVTEGDLDVGALAPEAVVRTQAAREVLAGSRAALAAMREALAGEAAS